MTRLPLKRIHPYSSEAEQRTFNPWVEISKFSGGTWVSSLMAKPQAFTLSDCGFESHGTHLTTNGKPSKMGTMNKRNEITQDYEHS